MDSSIHEQEPAPSWGHSGGPSREALAHQGGGTLEVVARPGSPWPGRGPRPERLPGTPVPASPLMASRGRTLPGTTC